MESLISVLISKNPRNKTPNFKAQETFCKRKIFFLGIEYNNEM